MERLLRDTSGIYGILNTLNGHSYIGSASNISVRWHAHRKSLNNGTHFNKHLQAAWNKYGETSFELNVLENCDKKDLVVREQWWIDDLKPEYNKALIVTNGTRGLKIAPHSAESREQAAAKRRGVPTNVVSKGSRKLTMEQAEEIRRLYGPWYPKGKGRRHSDVSLEELGVQFGISTAQVGQIVRMETYTREEGQITDDGPRKHRNNRRKGGDAKTGPYSR